MIFLFNLMSFLSFLNYERVIVLMLQNYSNLKWSIATMMSRKWVENSRTRYFISYGILMKTIC